MTDETPRENPGENGIASVREAVGDELMRAVRAHEAAPWFKRRRSLALAACVVVIAVPGGIAAAGLLPAAEFVPPEVPATSTAVPEAMKPFCDAMPCTFITTEKWEGAKTGYELNKLSTPASECPDQAAVYEAAGYTNLGGFTGPCPTAKQMENIEPNDPNELEDRIAGSANGR